MANELKAEDILKMIEKLSIKERRRLFRLVLGQERTDALTYAQRPPHNDEFSSDEDHLSWDAEGWEDVK